jgi:succinyl-CoA synthetase beta subunit
MKLYEFEGKQLLSQIKIPIPHGAVAATGEAARDIAARIGYPVVLKSQVLQGGRGKARGIRFVNDPQELAGTYKALSNLTIGQEPVSQILIEEKLTIFRELYTGITVDPKSAKPMLMISSKGGVDIEQVAAEDPAQIVKKPIDALALPKPFDLIPLVKRGSLEGKPMVQVANLLEKLIRCYFRFEAITAEINPLVIDDAGKLIAADAKFDIDDAALFRHPQIAAFSRSEAAENPFEREARAAGVSYVRLEDQGFIGIISGGAGLGMATMDAVYHHGGVPSNFLDLGHATPEKTAAALRIVLKTPGVSGVFLNAYGGINNCEEMAKGVITVIDSVKPQQAIVVKMRGHSQEAGWALLEQKNIPIVKTGTTADGIEMLKHEMQKKGDWPHVDPR